MNEWKETIGDNTERWYDAPLALPGKTGSDQVFNQFEKILLKFFELIKHLSGADFSGCR